MSVLDHTREGRGRPTIVFVHGFGCARDDWRHQVAHFRRTHETVALDLGAHGTTPGRPAHAFIDQHGEDVATLLCELALENVVLVGHSMGCRVVMHAMRQAPERISGLILLDGSRMGTPGSTLHETRHAQVAHRGYQAFIRPLFAQMFGPQSDPAIVQPIIARALARPEAIAGQLFPNIGRWDAEQFDATFSTTRVPLMAIQTTYMTPEGERSSMQIGQSTPYLDDIRRLVPGARLEIIPNASHFPQIEQPDEVNALIGDFLADLAR
jgi:pimeloyl-ACP methyl ester carboxylesterase